LVTLFLTSLLSIKTFKKVDKIVGPGNMFVATAKKEVFGVRELSQYQNLTR